MTAAAHPEHERSADRLAATFDRDAPLEAGRETSGVLGPATVRAAERTTGTTLPGVRLHSGPAAAGEAARLGAAAFTVGRDVFLGAPAASPSAARRVLAHELSHVVQQHHDPGLGIQLTPGPPQGPTFPTISHVLTPDGDAFRPEFPDLQARYLRYRVGRTNPAPPARWVKLARDSNRAALLAVLGPNLGDEIEPENPDEADVLRVAELVRPASYSDEQLRRDLELMQRSPGALDARLGTIPADQLQRGEFAGGYVRIASGNVGEALAEPVLQQRLQQVRLQHPDAQIFRNVRVRMPYGTNVDGSVRLTEPLLFSDGIIGRFTGSGTVLAGLQLQLLYVQEVKSGSHGGQEGTEQTFRWIERNIDDGARLVLADGREFEYDPTAPGGVTGMMSAPRGIVTGRGVGQLGAGGSMGIAAPVERIEMARSPAEMRYLAGLVLQSLWAREQLRLLQQRQRTAYEVRSSRDLTDPDVVRRIVDEHGGLAVLNDRLLEVRTSGGALSIRERPVLSLAFIYPAGTPVPSQLPVLPPGPLPPRQLGPGTPAAPPPPAPQIAPPQPTVPLLPAGGGTPPSPAPLAPRALGAGAPAAPAAGLPMLASSSAIRGGAVPATGLQTWLPNVAGVGNAEWIIWNGTIRDADGRPVTGYQEGETWVRVIRPGGTPLPEIDPATGAPAPTVRAMTPQGPVTFQATPYEAPPPRPPSAGMRATAGAVGLIMVVNELLGPIAATRNVQRQLNEKRRGQVAFLTALGADLEWKIEDMKAPLGASTLPWSTEQEVGAVGDWRAVRITRFDAPAFLAALPSRLPDFQSLLLFLSSARGLGLVEQDGTHYYLRLPELPGVEMTTTIEKIRSERLRGIDAAARADLQQKGHEGLYRIKPGAQIQRYGDVVRTKGTLGKFHSPVLTAPELIGNNAWVREVGPGDPHPSNSDRLHVEPANAEAAALAQGSLYIVHDDIESVCKQVEQQGRQIISRESAYGTLYAFSAGPFPPELGATYYERHPDPDSGRIYTVASGELRQFWIDRDDVEPVKPEEASAYAQGTPAAPPPSRLFTTEKRQDLPLI